MLKKKKKVLLEGIREENNSSVVHTETLDHSMGDIFGMFPFFWKINAPNNVGIITLSFDEALSQVGQGNSMVLVFAWVPLTVPGQLTA